MSKPKYTFRRYVEILDSSIITRLAYDDGAGVASITFKPGATYLYTGVSPALFCEMLNAPSVGEYFTNEIKSKPKKYPFEKV